MHRPEDTTLLVVEDSRTQAEKLRMVLAAAGYQAVVAHDGERALALCREMPRPPDAIISDIVMPGIDGYEVCRRARRDELLREVPVLLLTSLSNPADVLRALEAGADNYCTKPYQPDVLILRVQRMLDRSRRASNDTVVELEGQHFDLGDSPNRLANVLLSSLVDAGGRYNELELSRTRLAENNAQREEMMRVVAHEMRSPLQSMLLISELCQTREDDLTLLRSMPDRVVRMVQRILRLIEDLSDLSNIDLGTLRLDRSEFDLTPLVRDTLERVQSTTKSHRIEMEAPKHLEVYGDLNRIEQVVTNLLTNAVKYSPEANRVLLTVSRQDLDVRVAVRDFGIGIAEDEVPRIFDRYFRTDQGKDRAEGVGLGLYICKALIEAHGGEIGVTSKLGEGSTFWFTLPVTLF
ncbi:hybrid sensor histidine kinase/response regulator [Haliangium ochraceum]|uniref:hybrid sensor histidine kinase/response regulator n=1 Tax=Haliangium ochraceum TaxID=80816 RepID=UPI00019BA7BC|nr:hybrid sensor histidine kinase/response regulator [Haliangium ochraceum]